jgi:hypothetical protein
MFFFADAILGTLGTLRSGSMRAIRRQLLKMGRERGQVKVQLGLGTYRLRIWNPDFD